MNVFVGLVPQSKDLLGQRVLCLHDFDSLLPSIVGVPWKVEDGSASHSPSSSLTSFLSQALQKGHNKMRPEGINRAPSGPAFV